MKSFVAGRWIEGDRVCVVTNPFDHSTIDTVPNASANDAEAAIVMAVKGAAVMRAMPGWKRGEILRRASSTLLERINTIANQLSMEEGKPLAESLMEVTRAANVLLLSAEEACRIGGEVLPMDGASNGGGTFGFTLRVPCGVVVAITPFNFPLNLPCHKVGPALASGNAVILKPASDTPLSAIAFVEVLLDSGCPPEAISCLTGSGKSLGGFLVSDKRVRKVSFTGSHEVGERIVCAAGLKRITMELGSNAPRVVLHDADLDLVAQAIVATGYANAGQVCISAQRIIAVDGIYADLIDRVTRLVRELKTGNPFDPSVCIGPMIRSSDAERVATSIRDAVSQGARVTCGGSHDGALHEPTVVVDVKMGMTLEREELFGPAVAFLRASDTAEAVRMANATRYGLAASLFTRDISQAMHFVQNVDAGNLHINWGPQWRADFMPYGGLKESGIGKEGPKYTMLEMTESKTVIFHGIQK